MRQRVTTVAIGAQALYPGSMSAPHPELLVLTIALVALALAPLASKLVRDVGDHISGELDGGRSGDELNDHLDEGYGGALQDDEIRQMIEARAFVRGEAPPDTDTAVRRALEAHGAPPPQRRGDAALREEVRQVVVAGNERRARAGEPPLDVEAEVERRVARLLAAYGD